MELIAKVVKKRLIYQTKVDQTNVTLTENAVSYYKKSTLSDFFEDLRSLIETLCLTEEENVYIEGCADGSWNVTNKEEKCYE